MLESVTEAGLPEHPSGSKQLLVCSTGGHLTELLRIDSRIGTDDDSLWVTFDTPQSRTLLAGRRVEYLPYVGPRGLRRTLSAMPAIEGILRRERFDGALSTGAAIATVALPMARAHGIPSTYIESVCRLRGPSTTGRMLERVPGVALRTQHIEWAGPKWQPYPSILADFHSIDRALPDRPLRLFVTLGTIHGYRFDSLVDAVLATGLANDETVWQLGDTDRPDALPGTVRDQLSGAEFAATAAAADVVIAHAGVGTLLEMVGMGIYHVQAIRRSSRKEHVDDHQAEIADLVNASGIGVAVEAPELTASVILHAAARRIVASPSAPAELLRVGS